MRRKKRKRREDLAPGVKNERKVSQNEKSGGKGAREGQCMSLEKSCSCPLPSTFKLYPLPTLKEGQV